MADNTNTWIIGVQFIFNVIWVVAGAISLRRKATTEEIQAVAKKVEALESDRNRRCGDHTNRTTTLEVLAQRSPTHADLGAVYERLATVTRSVDELSGLIKGIGGNVRLLVEHHLKGENK